MILTELHEKLTHASTKSNLLSRIYPSFFLCSLRRCKTQSGQAFPHRRTKILITSPRTREMKRDGSQYRYYLFPKYLSFFPVLVVVSEKEREREMRLSKIARREFHSRATFVPLFPLRALPECDDTKLPFCLFAPSDWTFAMRRNNAKLLAHGYADQRSNRWRRFLHR